MRHRRKFYVFASRFSWESNCFLNLSRHVVSFRDLQIDTIVKEASVLRKKTVERRVAPPTPEQATSLRREAGRELNAGWLTNFLKRNRNNHFGTVHTIFFGFPIEHVSKSHAKDVTCWIQDAMHNYQGTPGAAPHPTILPLVCHAHKPPMGFEPMTSRLLSGCSTN